MFFKQLSEYKKGVNSPFKNASQRSMINLMPGYKWWEALGGCHKELPVYFALTRHVPTYQIST